MRVIRSRTRIWRRADATKHLARPDKGFQVATQRQRVWALGQLPKPLPPSAEMLCYAPIIRGRWHGCAETDAESGSGERPSPGSRQDTPIGGDRGDRLDFASGAQAR